MRFFESGGNPVTGNWFGPTIDQPYFRRTIAMKNSTKDTTKGVFHQLAGKAKVIAGKGIKSPGLEAEGKVEMVAGKIQEKTGQVKKALEK